MVGRPKGTPKTGGRRKGTQNKTTIAAKKALEEAFDGVGGIKSLMAWANDNPTDFYKLWAKLLPMQVIADIAVTKADVTDEIMEPEEWVKQSSPHLIQ